MYRDRNLFIRVVVLGALCAGLFRVAAADDYTYQSLTNLGPCASSRVLLMNNDTNPICPIQGQGYHDSSNTVEVGQTYWWHDDVPVTEVINSSGRTPNYYFNLQDGAHHVLYYKTGEGTEPVKLWELIDCRAGSAARTSTGTYNYLPWSSTCQPIDANQAAPIPATWQSGYDNSNGTKQVATIVMRATKTAAIYSPVFNDGIGTIFFDAVNVSKTYNVCHIAVDVAYRVKDESSTGDISSETDMDKLDWERQICEVYVVTRTDGYVIDTQSNGKDAVLLNSSAVADNKFYRVAVRLNKGVPVRLRIVRIDVDPTNSFLDYNDLILVDNIVVSYPVPSATLTPPGIEANGEGFANIGRVGAFTDPLLSKGLTNVFPRMTFSANTNGLPPFIDWKASATNSDFVWRWHYLNQAYGPWTTNNG